MITTVTGKNQITIPAELARELNISPGTRLDWAKGETGVLIVKIIPNRAELARRLAGRGRRHLREGSNPIRDLVEDRVREDLQEGLQRLTSFSLIRRRECYGSGCTRPNPRFETSVVRESEPKIFRQHGPSGQ